MIATVVRKCHFNAAHRLHNVNWSDEKNKEVFGVCNNPQYHGHNYIFLIKVTGEISSETGYIIDTKYLSDISKKYVEDKFDHRNLNLDTDEFKTLNPTAENIAVVIHNLLRPHIEAKLQLSIELFETDRNSVIYNG